MCRWLNQLACLSACLSALAILLPLTDTPVECHISIIYIDSIYANAPAAVVAALESHGEANAEVAWQGLWAIQQLAAVHGADAVEPVDAEACKGDLCANDNPQP